MLLVSCELLYYSVESFAKPATKDRPGYRDYKEVPSLESRIGKENTEICLEHINKWDVI